MKEKLSALAVFKLSIEAGLVEQLDFNDM